MAAGTVMEGVTPLLIPLFSVLVGAISTLVLGRLSSIEKNMVTNLSKIEAHFDKLNGKLFDHVSQSSIHEGAFARTDEQIKALSNVVKVAHERVDRLEAKG